MIRILMVEDDVEIARIVKYYLAESDQYEVVWAKTAEEAIVASRDWFDLILLDVMLPDQKGTELCARLREWHKCPVIFLSCLDDSGTIIEALENGGDDYITKPFDNKVLQARIRANLRRVEMEHAQNVQNLLQCSGFTLDAAGHTVSKGSSIYQLPPTEFRMLSFLMQHPGQCFRSSELYRIIWGQLSYGDNRTVAVHMHHLRKKLEDDPAHPRYLKSVWGKGYTFDPEGRPEN